MSFHRPERGVFWQEMGTHGIVLSCLRFRNPLSVHGDGGRDIGALARYQCDLRANNLAWTEGRGRGRRSFRSSRVRSIYQTPRKLNRRVSLKNGSPLENESERSSSNYPFARFLGNELIRFFFDGRVSIANNNRRIIPRIYRRIVYNHINNLCVPRKR